MHIGTGIAADIPALMDFSHGKKTMPFAAVVHKRSLQTRLHFDDDTVVDITFDLFFTSRFDGKFFEYAILHDRDAALFLVGDVDEHLFLHMLNLFWNPR